MFLYFILSLSLLFLVLALKFVRFFISSKYALMREEMSSYECGFEHHDLARVPFSLRYFFLTLVFLLFDLEVVLIMFFPSFIFFSSFIHSVIFIFIFIFILYSSLIYE